MDTAREGGEAMKKQLFARLCSITGTPMNEGYCINDGEMYIAHRKDMISHLRKISQSDWFLLEEHKIQAVKWSDEQLLEHFYESDYYYYTEWEIENEMY